MSDHAAEVEPSLIAAQASDPEARSLLIAAAVVTEPAGPCTHLPEDAPLLARAIELARYLRDAQFRLGFDREAGSCPDRLLPWVSLRFLTVAHLAKTLPVDLLTTTIRVTATCVANAINPVVRSIGHDPRLWTERTAGQARAALQRAYRLYGQELERLQAELTVAIENGTWSDGKTVIPVQDKAQPAWERLEFSPDCSVAILDGESHRLKSAGAGEFLKALGDAKGATVKARQLERIGRPDRLYAGLPLPLKAIVEPPGRGQTGYRMLPHPRLD